MDRANNFRNERLKALAFDTWRSELTKNDDDSRKRSRMYSIFSAWKFYTKERTLLKRFLIECGQSIGDLSCMTTMQLREAADIRKG